MGNLSKPLKLKFRNSIKKLDETFREVAPLFCLLINRGRPREGFSKMNFDRLQICILKGITGIKNFLLPIRRRRYFSGWSRTYSRGFLQHFVRKLAWLFPCFLRLLGVENFFPPALSLWKFLSYSLTLNIVENPKVLSLFVFVGNSFRKISHPPSDWDLLWDLSKSLDLWFTLL